jgi:hypothetical protein
LALTSILPAIVMLFVATMTGMRWPENVSTEPGSMVKSANLKMHSSGAVAPWTSGTPPEARQLSVSYVVGPEMCVDVVPARSHAVARRFVGVRMKHEAGCTVPSQPTLQSCGAVGWPCASQPIRLSPSQRAELGTHCLHSLAVASHPDGHSTSWVPVPPGSQKSAVPAFLHAKNAPPAQVNPSGFGVPSGMMERLSFVLASTAAARMQKPSVPQ